MRDADSNRLNMYRTVNLTLDKPEHLAVWKDKPPEIFTERVDTLRTMLTDLEAHLARLAAETKGITEKKQREEEELEVIAHETGGLLSEYFLDKDREDASAEVYHSLSDWQALTDQSLLARARLLIDHLNTALTADAATLAKYDLKPASLASLQKEFNDYDQIVNAPQEAKTGGKALNKELRPKFRAITRHLIRMDKLVLRFRQTPAGKSFATAYTAARNIHDRGKGPSTVESEPT